MMSTCQLDEVIAQAIELYPSQSCSDDAMATLQRAPLTHIVAQLQNFLCNESTVNAALHMLACSAVHRESITDEQVALLVQFFVEKIAIDAFARATLSSLAFFLRDGSAPGEKPPRAPHACSPAVFRVLMDAVLSRLATRRLPLPARRERLDVMSYMLSPNTLSCCRVPDLQVLLDVVDGESDPELVLRVFQLHLLIYHSVPETVWADVRMDYFDSVSSYFPIAFAQPVGCKVTKKDLKRALAACLSHRVYLDMCIPFLLDKLASPSNVTKQDGLHVLSCCMTGYGACCPREQLQAMVHTLRNEFIKLTTVYHGGTTMNPPPAHTRQHAALDSCLSAILTLLQVMSRLSSLNEPHSSAAVLELFAPITEGAIGSMSVSPDTQVASAYATMLYHIITASWSVGLIVGGYLFAMLSSRGASIICTTTTNTNTSHLNRNSATKTNSSSAHVRNRACFFQLFAALNTGLVVCAEESYVAGSATHRTSASNNGNRNNNTAHSMQSPKDSHVTDEVEHSVSQHAMLGQQEQQNQQQQLELQQTLQPAHDAVQTLTHDVVQHWLRCSHVKHDSEQQQEEEHRHALLCAVEFLVSLLKLARALPRSWLTPPELSQAVMDGLVYAAVVPRGGGQDDRVASRITALLRDFAVLEESAVVAAVQRQLQQPPVTLFHSVDGARVDVDSVLHRLNELVYASSTMRLCVLQHYLLCGSGDVATSTTDEEEKKGGWLCCEATPHQRARAAHDLLSRTAHSLTSLTAGQVGPLVRALFTRAHQCKVEDTCANSPSELPQQQQSLCAERDYWACCCALFACTSDAVRKEMWATLLCDYRANRRRNDDTSLTAVARGVWLLAALLCNMCAPSFVTCSTRMAAAVVAAVDDEEEEECCVTRFYRDVVQLTAQPSPLREVGFHGVMGLVRVGWLTPSQIMSDATQRQTRLGELDRVAHTRCGAPETERMNHASTCGWPADKDNVRTNGGNVSLVMTCVAALWGARMRMCDDAMRQTKTDACTTWSTSSSNESLTAQSSHSSLSLSACSSGPNEVRATLRQLISAAVMAKAEGDAAVEEALLSALAEQPLTCRPSSAPATDSLSLLEDYLECVAFSMDSDVPLPRETLLRRTVYWKGLCALLTHTTAQTWTARLLHGVVAHMRCALKRDTSTTSSYSASALAATAANDAVTPATLIDVLTRVMGRCSEAQQLMFIVAVMRASCEEETKGVAEETEGSPGWLLLHAILSSALHAPRWTARCDALHLLTSYARGLDAMSGVAQDGAADKACDDAGGETGGEMWSEVAPIKRAVLRATMLCLCDTKRRVRQAAAQCRERWFKLP